MTIPVTIPLKTTPTPWQQYNEKFQHGKISFHACKRCQTTTPHTRTRDTRNNQLYYKCTQCDTEAFSLTVAGRRRPQTEIKNSHCTHATLTFICEINRLTGVPYWIEKFWKPLPDWRIRQQTVRLQ